MMSLPDMRGKVAVLTGAAGGVGSATARLLAAAGASLCLVDLDEASLQRTAASLPDPAHTLCLATDLAVADNCTRCIERTIERFGRVDALCNIAAVFIACHFGQMSDADWQKTLDVNLSAPARLIRAALAQLVEHRGSVVNVTSCAAHVGQAYTVAYAATKAGLTHLTRSLAMEHMHTGVRFNAVAPGGMMTALAAGMRDLENPDPSLAKRYSPLRGLVDIEQVARMVAFLASDASSSYHGAVINIDNGITAG